MTGFTVALSGALRRLSPAPPRFVREAPRVSGNAAGDDPEGEHCAVSDWTPPTSPPTSPPLAPATDPWAPVRGTAPPTAPPGWSATNPPPPSDPPPGSDGRGGRGRGRGAAVAIASIGVLALVLLAGGLGLVASRMGDGDDLADFGSAPTPTEVEQREADDPPLEGNSDEPVAAVAEAVSPAVVQLEVGQGLGSGVVYDADGLILTANHVVEGQDEVTVRFSDGTAVTGEVLGGNVFSDIAVVKIDPMEDLPVAALGDSDELQPGQVVVGIGSPFGLDQTVTSGIVSAVNRPAATQSGIVNMVQTDTAINPGNSGGPLVDIQGRVIGINDQIFSQGGGNDGIGLAIPINLAVRVADTIAAGQPVEFGFLGVGAAQQTSTTSPGLETGAVIASVESGSAGAEAGLQEGDRVLAIDGEPVASFEELAGIVSAEAPNSTVTFLVERSGEQREVDITLGAAQRD